MKKTMKGINLYVYVISILKIAFRMTREMSVNIPAIRIERKAIRVNWKCLVNIQTNPGMTRRIIKTRIKVLTFSNVVQLLKRFIIISIVIFSSLY